MKTQEIKFLNQLASKLILNLVEFKFISKKKNFNRSQHYISENLSEIKIISFY